MRGEQVLARRVGVGRIGSPPLARGTVYATLPGTRFSGITPACAGNSFHNPPHARGAWDHPRLRGEQIKSLRILSHSGGSPPLARGTVGIGYVQGFADGITPACAGNSSALRNHLLTLWDHPRLRGEQPFIYFFIVSLLGSPPLARGTDGKPFVLLPWERITPACAGNRP